MKLEMPVAVGHVFFTCKKNTGGVFNRHKTQEDPMKKLIVTALMVVLALSSAVLSAQDNDHNMRLFGRGMMPGHDRGGHEMGPAMLDHLKEQLALTPDQVKKLEAIHNAHQEWMIKKHAEIELASLKLKNYLKADGVNRKEAERMIRSLSTQHADVQVAHFQFMQDMKDALTPEQLKKFELLRHDTRRGMMQRRFGNPGGRPGANMQPPVEKPDHQ
jgi:Spy/CpxP family protein refolding chaperone